MVASDPVSKGYWLAASDGGVFTFGGVKFYYSIGGEHLNSPIVAISDSANRSMQHFHQGDR
jgi:hypothetical protein